MNVTCRFHPGTDDDRTRLGAWGGMFSTKQTFDARLVNTAGGYVTLENQGSSEARDSDGDSVTHRSDPVSLSAGENNSDIDFGFYRPGGCGTGKGNNGVGNGFDPQPPGNPPINEGEGTAPGHPGNKGIWNHQFARGPRDAKHDGGSDHSNLIDWTCKSHKTDPYHHRKIQPCSSWVKTFVCNLAANDQRNPNSGIQICLGHLGEHPQADPKRR